MTVASTPDGYTVVGVDDGFKGGGLRVGRLKVVVPVHVLDAGEHLAYKNHKRSSLFHDSRGGFI
jgi:hypothetical protein